MNRVEKPATRRSRRKRATALHYFTIHVSPLPGSINSARGGAYISCWVNYPHADGALVLAKHYIREYGWRVRKVEEHKCPTRADYARDPNRQYFDEAAADGASFVVHTYPPGESGSNRKPQRKRR